MTRIPLALVVGVDPAGRVRIRCPFCRRIHIHRVPRRDGEHQSAPCGSPSGYRVTWLRKPPDEKPITVGISEPPAQLHGAVKFQSTERINPCAP